MKDLRITPASFEDALELQDAVSEALAEKDMTISQEIFQGEIDGATLGTMVKMILTVAKNKRLRESLFTCAASAVYKNQRIDKEFFEPIATRALYYPIMIEVLKENLGPFLESLTGQLSGLKDMVKTKSPEL